MKVFVWEPAASETIESLSGQGDLFDYHEVSSKDELMTSVQNEEQMCLMIIDVDSLGNDVIELDQELAAFSLHKRLYSSELKTAKELKKLQADGLSSDAFLKRPHNYKTLYQVLTSFYDEFMQDSPADMTKGGTAEFDIEATLVQPLDSRSDEADLTMTLADESVDMGDSEDDQPTTILNMDDVKSDLNSDEAGEIDFDLEFDAVSGDDDEDKTEIVQGELTETEIGLFPDNPPEAPVDNQSMSDDSDAGELEFDIPSNPESTADGTLTGLDELNNEKEEFSFDDEDSGEGSIEVHTSSESGVDIAASPSMELDETEQPTTTLMVDSASIQKPDTDDDASVEMTMELGEENQIGENTDATIQNISLQEFRPDANQEDDEDRTLFSSDIDDDEDKTTVFGGQAPSSGINFDELKKDHDDISQFHSDELLRLKVTIENLRQDREHLLAKLAEAEKSNSELKFKMNSFQSELDEAKIELGFLRKKSDKDIEDMKYAFELNKEKKGILEEKNKELKKELSVAQQKLKFDYRKVQEREKELEGQLELLKSDSENLLRSRDNKILELKRSIDGLEFDVETASERERRAKHDKFALEEKLERIMATLRRTIGSLDEDLLSEKAMDPDKKLTEL